MFAKVMTNGRGVVKQTEILRLVNGLYCSVQFCNRSGALTDCDGLTADGARAWFYHSDFLEGF